MTSASEEAESGSSEPPTDDESHDVEGMEEMAEGGEAGGETTCDLAKGVGAVCLCGNPKMKFHEFQPPDLSLVKSRSSIST